MEYNFKEIEKRWSQFWKENNTYRVEENNGKPKFYVLDMFPYPSGAGLHVERIILYPRICRKTAVDRNYNICYKA